MKKLLLCLLMASFSIMNAQSDETVQSRKGAFIVETGLTSLGTIFGGASGSTGANFISSDGETITNIAFSGGTFISENLALRARLNLISSFGETYTFLSVGPKFYAGGSFPISLEIGKGFGGQPDDFIGSFSGGYAFVLANNIYLEPTVGYVFPFEGFGDGFINIGAGFSLLF